MKWKVWHIEDGEGIEDAVEVEADSAEEAAEKRALKYHDEGFPGEDYTDLWAVKSEKSNEVHPIKTWAYIQLGYHAKALE